MDSVASNLCRCKKKIAEYELEVNYNNQVSILKLIQNFISIDNVNLRIQNFLCILCRR